MPFVKGQGGRKLGAKNKPLVEVIAVKELAAKVLLGDNPEAYIRDLRQRIRSSQAPRMELFLSEHLWGKPKDDSTAAQTSITVNVITYVAIANVDSQGPQAAPGAGDHRYSAPLSPEELPTPISGRDAGWVPTRATNLASKIRERANGPSVHGGGDVAPQGELRPSVSGSSESPQDSVGRDEPRGPKVPR